jgi:uncharacterized protein YndB with AHSA1/START domain
MKLIKLFLCMLIVAGASTSLAENKGAPMVSKDIVFDLNLHISVEEAWNFWTNSKKLEHWLTTEANVNAKIGGAYELFWDPTNHNENSTLGCKISAFVPYKLLAFQWRGPVPFADLMNVEPFPTWASVSFEATGVNQTTLHFRHSGWGEGERWSSAREWQKNAWTGAFKELENLTNKQ